MKLFTIGPTQMYDTTFKVRNKQIPYFRTKEFSEVVLETTELLKQFVNASIDSSVIWLTASGTGGMEATIMNCFDKNDKLLIIVGGNFGQRFADICDIHNIKYDVLTLNDGEALTNKSFEKFVGNGYTGVLVNLHETSTGQLYNIESIKKFCDEEGAYLIVDAIGTFLCDEFSMKDNNIDVVIISSQKGLCVSPGMAPIIISKRMIEKISSNKIQNMYFDFNNYLNNMQRGQTPFTPAIGVILEINDMLKYILCNGGINNRLKIIKERAKYFRNLVLNNGFYLPEYPLSNAVTPVRFKKPIAKIIFQKLKDDYGLIVNPVGGKYEDYMFRVAHIGNLTKEDYDKLMQRIIEIVNKIN